MARERALIAPNTTQEDLAIDGEQHRTGQPLVLPTSDRLAAELGQASERIGNLVRFELADPDAFMPRTPGVVYAPLVDLEIQQETFGPRLRWLGPMASAWTEADRRLVAGTAVRLAHTRVANTLAIPASRFDILAGDLRGLSFWEPVSTWLRRGPEFGWLLTRWLLVPATEPLFEDDERRLRLVRAACAVFEDARADALSPGVANAGTLH